MNQKNAGCLTETTRDPITLCILGKTCLRPMCLRDCLSSESSFVNSAGLFQNCLEKCRKIQRKTSPLEVF